MQTKNPKTIYLPYMCDHSYILAASFNALGTPAYALPPPDDESLHFDLRGVTKKECLPCILTTSDIVRCSQQPGFEPSNSIILMPTANGPCRFGQYSVLQRDILNDYGFQEVEFSMSSAGNAYQGFSNDPTKLRKLVLDGGIAVDTLQKLLHEYRPYELTIGQTDAIYQEGLQRIITATKNGGGNLVINEMKWAARQFESLAVDRSEPRPIIGVIGEIYLRHNTYSNQDIIRKVEAAGGEVRLAGLMEWIYFTTWDYANLTKETGRYYDFVVTKLTDLYQKYREHQVIKPVAHLLKYPHETSVGEMLNSIQPYLDPSQGTEAVLSIGKAIDLAKYGASGIINAMPFSCMPSIIVSGIAPRLRADLDNIPWLDVIFDGQASTNFHTRLEAFMYQTTQYYRREELRIKKLRIKNS